MHFLKKRITYISQPLLYAIDLPRSNPGRKEGRPLDNRRILRGILIEYCDLQVEIKELRRLVEMTEDRLRRIEEEGVVSDVVSGGMGGTEHFKVTGFPTPEHDRVKRLLASRKARLKMKEEELLELTNKAEEYIETIEKSELRTMFRLYYIEGLTWSQVAMRMNHLFPKRRIAYTEDNCWRRNKRFFEKL